MITVDKSLKARWDELKTQEPNLRIRAAATKLGVSEAQLLATQLGEGVTRLAGDWEALLKRVPELGKAMALTRNEAVVIEKTGPYNKPEFFSHGGPSIGQVVGPEIDLRLFMHAWHHGFAVQKAVRNTTMYSLQFFDAAGDAVHKIYLRDKDKLPVYESIVEEFRAGEQAAPALEPRKTNTSDANDTAVDAEAFLEGWANMTNTHDFFHLLRKHKVSRTHALELAKGRFAWPLSGTPWREALTKAAETELPIMVFAGNPGCLEIHTGPVKKLLPMEDWFNVMDPGFNLHINEPQLQQCWITEKPTDDGIVSALECFDAHGNMAVQFFGERKPGRKELEGWREIVAGLKAQSAEQ